MAIVVNKGILGSRKDPRIPSPKGRPKTALIVKKR